MPWVPRESSSTLAVAHMSTRPSWCLLWSKAGWAELVWTCFKTSRMCQKSCSSSRTWCYCHTWVVARWRPGRPWLTLLLVTWKLISSTNRS
ncbi:unnamed protein product [Linum tenue]|uniref:Secreted protein n=2 Tax=Linum tenue TaxID=586396 RepID=A0AAV0KN30_9ROSI|nr:unnamed protein product [Linum tenue]